LKEIKILRYIDKTTDVNFFRKEISKEKTVFLDFGYLAGVIESWWKKNNNQGTHALKSQLINLFLTYLRTEDTAHFGTVGLRNGHAAICITNIFNLDSPKLALTVHEALADLFHLTDIKYEYEEHKALFLKPSAEKHREWGNGHGDITPHSDDLYENLDVDYLALTVCRDITKTPTAYYFPSSLLCELNDQEIHELLTMEAAFISGKNVSDLKKRVRQVVKFSEIYGFQFSLDFRIDPQNGARMRAVNGGQHVLDKIRSGLSSAKNHVSIAETGTFLIVANHKVLHARPMLNLDADQVRAHANNSTFNNTPRLLFRSKGPRKQYYALNETACTREAC
jgi:hypothetical protein